MIKLTFIKPYSCYNVGEVASFPQDVAQKLIDQTFAREDVVVEEVLSVGELPQEEEILPEELPAVSKKGKK
jgi:hypothetical protein